MNLSLQLACLTYGGAVQSNNVTAIYLCRQFRREIETQAEIRTSTDAVEGRNAFLKKRAARFSGR